LLLSAASRPQWLGEAESILRHSPTRIVVCGHTHVPVAYVARESVIQGELDFVQSRKVIIPDDARDLGRIVADNAVQAGLVTGARYRDWRERRLLEVTVDLRIDGGEPAPAIPITDRVEPLDVLVWLANDLSRRGIGLDEGQIVTPGSVTVPQRLAPGSRAVAMFGGLDTITLSLVA